MVKLRRKGKGGEVGPGRNTRFLPIPIGMLAGPAGAILPQLLKYWKVVLFAALIGLIAYQNTVSFEFLRIVGIRSVPGVLQDLEEVKEEADRKVAIAEEQLAACEAGRETLKAEIERTNNEIARWVALSEQLQADQSTLQSALIDLKQKSTAELEIILQGPIPQTCEGAVKLLRDAVTKGDLVWKSKD